MTTLLSLEPILRIRLGDTVAGSYQWQPDELINVLAESIYLYNIDEPPQEFDITGSGDDRTYSPDPGPNDLLLLFLYAELHAAISENKRAIRGAVVRSTPLGSVNLTGVSAGWKAEIARIHAMIAEHKGSIVHVDTMSKVSARGMSQT